MINPEDDPIEFELTQRKALRIVHGMVRDALQHASAECDISVDWLHFSFLAHQIAAVASFDDGNKTVDDLMAYAEDIAQMIKEDES